MLELKKAGDNVKVVALMFTETNALQTVYIDAWKEFIVHETKLLNSGVQTAESTYREATLALYLALYLALAAALIAGVGVAALLTRWVLKSLGGEPAYAAEIARRIALGDLTDDVRTRPTDQSSLLFAMKRMRGNLARVVAQVRVGTDRIATATSEIANGNMDLSYRTELQASSLQQTAASMEQLTATVKQNAANAWLANELASTASKVAVRGGEVGAGVVNTMGAINTSSRKIVDIISVIDSIAFQTNILALNAAVEAARR